MVNSIKGDYSIVVLEQLWTLFCFILTGVVIGVVFDIFRIIRKSFKTSDIITYIEDILFWCLTGFILLFSIFAFNQGELRAYVFIGIILGIIFHLLVFFFFFVKIFVAILQFCKKILGIPFRATVQFTKKYILRPSYHFLEKIKEKISKLEIKKQKKDKISDKI